MICVRDTSATLSGTCPGLCRKVGVMEFGLKTTGITNIVVAYVRIIVESVYHLHSSFMISVNVFFSVCFNTTNYFPVTPSIRFGGLPL